MPTSTGELSPIEEKIARAAEIQAQQQKRFAKLSVAERRAFGVNDGETLAEKQARDEMDNPIKQ